VINYYLITTWLLCNWNHRPWQTPWKRPVTDRDRHPESDPTQIVTDTLNGPITDHDRHPESNPSQTVTDIASAVQLVVHCYKVLKEKLISLWENWKALGWFWYKMLSDKSNRLSSAYITDSNQFVRYVLLLTKAVLSCFTF